MDERIEYKGYWWSKSNPKKNIAGTITYSPYESITLELIGSFYEEDYVTAFLQQKHENIIYGLTSESKKVTLVNCSAYGSLNSSCPFPIQKYACQYLIIGTHIDDIEQCKFFKADVEYPLLSNWCNPCAIYTSLRWTENGKIDGINISFNSNREHIDSVCIDDRTQLVLNSGINYEGNYYSPKIEQYTFLNIVKNTNASILDFLSDIAIYEKFLSFATMQEVRCSDIKLYSQEEYQEINNEKSYNSIQLLYIHSDYTPPIEKHSCHFLFNYNWVKDKYPIILKKWYSDSDIAPIRQHLIDSIKPKKVFSSVDFLIVVQAIEGFHIRFRKEVSLTETMNQLIEEFSDIYKIKQDTINVREVVDSRNYYSHFMDRKKKKHIVDGYDLYTLTIKLKRLLVCCLLNFIGFENDEINMILTKSNNPLFR